MDSYLIGFVLILIGFSVLERVFPWQKQERSAKHIGLDIAYQFLNYKPFALVAHVVVLFFYQSLVSIDLPELSWIRFLKENFWISFICYLFIFDFFEYWVHQALHRVPFLWKFHKVHHSIDKMDCLGNMHFHPIEMIVYKGFTYIPHLLIIPLIPENMLLTFVMVRVFIGTFAHSNLNVNIGILSYIINNPRVHIWHHANDERAVNKNCGVTFTLWDFIFGTAFFPKSEPYPKKGLGFEGSKDFQSLKKQVYPL